MEGHSEATSAETVVIAQRTASSVPAEEGRFVPGTLLGSRYRIIALLGRGGMGEVYRATDLTLGQSVALKFLPEEAARNQHLLERFHAEVRIARQVSHPNVCRVYDIGDADGTPFISMEYVDGEDLSSLLKRIGRLPADKAVETARKICAGLAAAHDRGIVHRDLKPQNIMLDKRGEVIIMDFGLAAVAGELGPADARSGTPAYMSPEQLKGSEVTARSDIYALGLVLYELFTGKRPYEAKTVRQMLDMQEAAQLTSMTSVAADIDPAVEKAIRRCLDPEPVRRPPSALSVAAALPGGDPLAAAMAAGETPSPEMVAAAGETEGLARKYSIPCLLLVLLCLCTVPLVRSQVDAFMHAPLDYSPEVLAQKARDLADSFGYSKRPADWFIGLASRNRLLDELKRLPEPRRWDDWLAAESPLMASYRESLSPLVARPRGDVSKTNPAPIEPGMVYVRLDGGGRLREFSAIPYDAADALPNPVPPDAVLRAAGLDMAAFTETTPDFLPPVPADQVRAWKGPHPVIPKTQLTVEIAFWKGRITLARVAFPWERTAQQPASLASTLRDIYTTTAIFAAFLLAALFARRNWKLGRIDRKGALRIAAASFVLDMAGWIGSVHAVPRENMIDLFTHSAATALLGAALLWMVYLALEPAVRARWPHSIVTWNRLLAGNWRDAQVGSHVLIGAALGSVIWTSASLIQRLLGPENALDGTANLFDLLGPRQWFATWAFVLSNGLTIGLVGFFIIFGFRTLLRKDLLAAAVAAVAFTFFESNVVSSPQWMLMAAIYVCIYGILIFVLLRFGLVATLAAVVFINGPGNMLLGLDWKTWFAPYGLANLALLLAIAFLAFWRSLGSRGLLGDQAPRLS